MQPSDSSQQLRHEHLVRINDPANPSGAWLTRQQLWEGLRNTVMMPQILDPSIDEVSVDTAADGTLQRCIRRGAATALDAVELREQESLLIRADTAGPFAGSSLTIRIEEPAPEMLFVRFVYELVGLEAGRTEEEDNARRDAYRTSDIERVRLARRYSSVIKN